MTLDASELADHNNFGLAPSLVRCSPTPEILFDCQQYSQAVLCRRSPEPNISSYTRQLTTEDRFRHRMQLLHNFVLIANFSGDRIDSFEPSYEHGRAAAYLKSVNHRKTLTSLSDLFPEENAMGTIAVIEEFCHLSREIHKSRKQIAIGFHTQIQQNEQFLHTDDFRVAVLALESGAIFVPKDACQQMGERKYRCLDYSQAHQAQPGDIFIANRETPHEECPKRFAAPDAHSRFAIRSQPHHMILDLD